jgi:predicted nucleotidyltransferase component of viral defense system
MAKNMIISELEAIVIKEKQKGRLDAFIKSALKEYLQVYVLNFIYTEKAYSDKLIFTGGTCLRHCYNLNRLSEDIDLDQIKMINLNQLKDNLLDYFKRKYLYQDLKIAIKQQGKQLLLKFPVLQTLKLADLSASDWLYVKIDLAPVGSKNYQTQTSLKNLYGFNYITTHYDLGSLMAGKIAAVLGRRRFQGKENQEIVKGRDYFDLLWFLDKKTDLNFKMLNDLLKEKKALTKQELVDRLNNKVRLATTKFKLSFKQDLQPFIENNLIIDDYVDNYLKNYQEKVKYLLEERLTV